MPDNPRLAFVVSHTHWDREWYLSFQRFRVQLLETVDAVLDRLEHDPGWRHFCLDGQLLALEDYLAARPGQAERVARLAVAGKLALGPWYVLPDEFLVSGEATVRNLQLGHAIAARFGGAQKVGYLPDTFGHLAQMPQILAQAGIDSFVYWRGHGDEDQQLGLEWWWQAPDGSRVLAINQIDGYVNAAALGHRELWHAHTRRALDPRAAVERIGALFAKMAPASRSDVWLLSNGCDHHLPQRELGAMLDALREAFPQTTFTHGSFADYLTALRASLPDAGSELPIWQGELLGGKQALILSGVWSSRLTLKQQNAACQDLLAHQLEPLLAYAHFMHGGEHRADLVDLLWRDLLKNHPHDSIGGCSIDRVHRDMVTRFGEVVEAGEHLISRTLEQLVPAFGPTEADDRETLITVANPLPWARTEVVDRVVILQPFGYRHDQLRIVDASGRPVPFVVKSRRFLQRFWGIDYRSELRADDQRARLATYLETFADRIVRTEADRDTELVDCFLEVQFLARDLPACGHTVFRVVQDGPSPAPDVLVRADGPVIENDLLRVTLHADGRFDLVDKLTGRAFAGLNALEDVEDAGDEYDWSPCPQTRTVSAAGVVGEVVTVEDTGLAAALEARFDLMLPRALTADRKARRAETVACPVVVTVRLTAGSDLADVTVRVDNRAEDHRLRAVFAAGVRTDCLVSDGHFLLAERPLAPPRGEHWAQPHPGTYPQQEFSLVRDAGGAGLAVIAAGLPEVAPVVASDGTAGFALTLLRCVGWLSRDDFPTRRHTNAGPTIPTPDAQCPGPHTLRYAVAPLVPRDQGPDVLRLRARSWLNPPLTRQGVAAGARLQGSLLAIDNPAVAVSAIRRHPKRDSLVVRLWNQTGRPQRQTLATGRPVVGAWSLDLLEERTGVLGLPVVVELAPHRIVTVELAFADPEGLPCPRAASS
jgi:mannosylglycerate hydrolase